MTVINQLCEHVTPLGKSEPVFLLYGLRSKDAQRLSGPDLSIWPSSTEVKHYALGDDWWPVSVELFEIVPPGWPDNVEVALISALSDLINQGAIISWYMLDGAFGDVSALFDSWHAENTYGIASHELAPTLALLERYRRSNEWQDILATLSEIVWRRFPDIRRSDIQR